MINLLPPEIKESYHYARRNVGLLNWVVSLFIVFLGLGVLAGYGAFTLHRSINNYQQQVTIMNQQLNKEHVLQTEKQVKNMTGSLKLAVQVLSQEVLFSKLITQIGAAMPAGSILTGLNINQTSGGINLAANTSSYAVAAQTQINLSNPKSGVFAKVDIVSIKCSTTNAVNKNYPCNVQLRALFNSNNQFLFINQGAKP